MEIQTSETVRDRGKHVNLGSQGWQGLKSVKNLNFEIKDGWHCSYLQKMLNFETVWDGEKPTKI